MNIVASFLRLSISCGAVELIETSSCQKYVQSVPCRASGVVLNHVACDRWGPVSWKVVSSSSLTDIPFPVASQLCTRFPTRIVSRRVPGSFETTKVSIEPKIFSAFDDGKYDQRKEGYESFSRTFLRMTSEDFKTVVDQVSAKYGPVGSCHADPHARLQI